MDFEKSLQEKLSGVPKESMDGLKSQLGQLMAENANLYISVEKLETWAKELFEENKELKKQLENAK